jgi:hypothetical protein
MAGGGMRTRSLPLPLPEFVDSREQTMSGLSPALDTLSQQFPLETIAVNEDQMVRLI